MTRMRSFCALAIGLLTQGCALRATAPIPHDDWARVAAISPGTAIRVWWLEPGVGPAAAKRDGRLSKADSHGIEIDSASGQLQLARPSILRVDVLLEGGDSITNGALLGAAVGAGYGLYVFLALRGEADNGAFIPVLTAGAGAFIGTLIDGVRPGRDSRTVYRATRQ
jgi:hypothetical protein